MANIEQRGNRYRVSICVQGIRRSNTLDTEAEAKRWAKIETAAILTGKAEAKTIKKHTLKDVLLRFESDELPKRKSERAEGNRIKWLLDNLPFVNKVVARLTTDDFHDWIEYRCQEVVGSTVNRDLNFLSTVFETARKKWRWIDSNIVHEVTRPANPKPRKRRVADWERDAVLAALGYTPGLKPVDKREQLAVVFLLAIETAMRIGEILSLTWDNVHADFVHLEETKNGDTRDVPLTPDAIELLGLVPRMDDRCFGTLNSQSADALWRNTLKKTKVVDLHFHDSRHEAITRLARKLDMMDLAKMVGHRDINSLKVYYNPTPSEMAARLAA